MYINHILFNKRSSKTNKSVIILSVSSIMYNKYLVDIPKTRDIQHQQGSRHKSIISVVQVVIQREHPKGFFNSMWFILPLVTNDMILSASSSGKRAKSHM